MTISEIQAESLRILQDVHSFCVSRGITYSVAYGTMIGAIRHKGFIPWDDDIDIIMPRKDYEEFCREYVSEDFKLECPENSSNYFLAFARVFDCKRTIAKTLVPWHDGDNGVWIDVFPADRVLDDFDEFDSHKCNLQRKWAVIAWGRWARSKFARRIDLKDCIKLIIKKVLSLNGLLTRFFLDSFIRSTNIVKKDNSEHWSQLTCLDGYEWHKVSDFQSVILMPFENSEVMVMNGWDSVLTECYGDYMQLPPEEKRKGHSVPFTKFYWK